MANPLLEVTEVMLDTSHPFEHKINFYAGKRLISSDKVKAYQSEELFKKAVQLWSDSLKEQK